MDCAVTSERVLISGSCLLRGRSLWHCSDFVRLQLRFHHAAAAGQTRVHDPIRL